MKGPQSKGRPGKKLRQHQEGLLKKGLEEKIALKRIGVQVVQDRIFFILRTIRERNEWETICV